MESVEYKGLWWLPESPDKQFPGVLTFHPIAGAILAVEGEYSPSPFPHVPPQFPGNRSCRIVAGKSKKPMTLVGLTWLSDSFFSSTLQCYRVDTIYKNEAFE